MTAPVSSSQPADKPPAEPSGLQRKAPELNRTDQPISESIAGLVRTDLQAMMRRHMPVVMLGAALNGVAMWLMVARHLPSWLHYLWLTVLALQFAGTLWLWRRRRSGRAQPAAHSRARPFGARAWQSAVAVTAMIGVAWGTGAALMYIYSDPQGRYAILLICATMGMGGIYSLAPRWRTFAAFVSGITVPMLLATSFYGTRGSKVLIPLVLFYWAFTVLASRALSRTLVDSLRLRYENAELISELAAERDAARTADSAKTRFLAAASHDLRQPLNALSLYLHTLRNEPLGEQAQRVVDQAQRSSASLASMFNGMMDAFRLEHGDIEPQWTQSRVWPLMEKLHGELLPLAQQRGLQLRLMGARDAHVWLVRWDTGLVERMLRNLVDNALRHTERGGVALVVRRRGNSVRLQVVDTGLGIDEASLAYLMRPYDRVQTRRGPVSNRGGTGLGLAIVEHMARLCEVPWNVRSALGRGTAVSLDLPWLGVAEIAHANAQTRTPATMDGVPWVGVAEDDPASLDALAQVLAKHGYVVVQARSAQTFRELVLAQTSPPYALLSDWRLGTDDGLALLVMLREEYLEPPNCVLFSGEWSRNLELACESSEVHYLSKPILPAALMRVIHAAPASHTSETAHQAPPSTPVRA